MAIEEDAVAAPTPTPLPSDHKRKLQDLEQPQQHEEVEGEEGVPPAHSIPNDQLNIDAGPEADDKAGGDVAESDLPDLKRPKLYDNEPQELEASENGFGEDKANVISKENVSESTIVDNEQGNDDEYNHEHPLAGEVQEPAENKAELARESHTASNAENDNVVTEKSTIVDNEQGNDDEYNHEHPLAGEVQEPAENEAELARESHTASNAENDNVVTEKPLKEENEKPSQEVGYEEEMPGSDGQTTTRKMEVPNDKVGVLIGKGGDTVRLLQYNSGAKIQITRDSEADPHSTTRPVELIGTLSSISKAEKLISDVIAEADAGGSPSLVARGVTSGQRTGPAEQLELQVPNEKVGLIIGRGGDTIKSLQSKSGARIQLIPQHLPEGDGSKDRIVRITGDKKHIEIAREMILDVMNQTVRPSSQSSGYSQQHSHRPRGSAGPGQWGPRGPHSSQGMSHDYHQRGPYPITHSQYPPQHYGNYPHQQMGPRNTYGSGWEHRPPATMQRPHSHGGGYDYYGSDHPVSAPISAPGPGHAPAPPPAPVMGPPQSQTNYNYGHQTPYSQTGPHQQGYGHGYDEPKYDNAPTQHTYGSYPQAGNQPSYGTQQQYGKPPPAYGMSTQGALPQPYGPPRPGQPGEMAYQGAIQSNQTYGANIPPHQQYPYAATGPMQQSYPPYAAADGYNQAPPASGYAQGGQPVPAYGHAGGQQAAGYAQGATTGYGAYPSAQQGYPEQPATNNAGYGYQAPQDPAYGSGTATATSVATSSQQGYTQPATTQPSYDQSAGYGATPGSAAPASYGKTVSPQPGYPQYDSTQMYSAPR